MNPADRVTIKSENQNQIVYLDGVQVFAISHFEDYAYTEAQNVRREYVNKIVKGEL